MEAKVIIIEQLLEIAESLIETLSILIFNSLLSDLINRHNSQLADSFNHNLLKMKVSLFN